MDAAQHTRLLVVSSHGRTGLKRLLLGSVSGEVLHTATCPSRGADLAPDAMTGRVRSAALMPARGTSQVDVTVNPEATGRDEAPRVRPPAVHAPCSWAASPAELLTSPAR
ncbi:universal stress protein [Streptomyces sp. SCSIO 30461]|uniref:universal stress protein n=1 Tax=Streptomyces sp. SCSIO 30461 TaxID=3118085 RepID=UPI0030D14D54